MNRAAGGLVLFQSPNDYNAFERLLAEAQQRFGMRVIAYCLMLNHWHFLLWPTEDQSLTNFLQWLTTTHARRWVLAHSLVGHGAVYQGRFKSVPVQTNRHLLTVWRYIERNPVRAGLVSGAELWPWSSLSIEPKQHNVPALTRLDFAPAREDWLHLVNTPQTHEELGRLRKDIDHDAPIGDPNWQERVAAATAWQPQGRPKRGRTPFSAELEQKRGTTP